MKTGFKGTFVISWSQTEIDGLEAAPLDALSIGAAWAWRGDAIRVDGPNDILRLDQADGADQLHKRAARMVHRLVGAALEKEAPSLEAQAEDALSELPVMDNSFVVTDGRRCFAVTVIKAGWGAPLLMFVDDIPPCGCELWVVHHTLAQSRRAQLGQKEGGMICFTPGTRIRTPTGRIRIEDLREGHLVETKDNGAQPIEWIGSRRVSGARLFAAPHLRPVTINMGFFGDDLPDGDLVVSPEHRILVEGAVARDLFNTPEVLVAAQDLINGETVRVDFEAQEVTYVHLLFDRHQVIWANGVETESFHPASAALGSLAEGDRMRLGRLYPELECDPYVYGGFARRNLSRSEAALLRHAA